jgi:hypothetical protein
MEEKRYLVDGLPDDTILMDLVHEAFRFLFTDELGQYLLGLLGIHYASCVVDTNVLLRDISWTLKKRRASSLILAARVGTLRLYASTQVRTEVPKKIRARATSFKMDPEAAYHLWKTTYRPLIRFLDPGEFSAQSKHLEELRHRDSDDLPTAQIIELLRPTVVLSEDQDLAAFGSIVVPATQITSAYRDHAERDAQFVMLGLGGGLALRVSLGMLSLIIQLLLRLNRRGLIILGAAVALLFVIPPTRRALLRGIQALRARLQEAFQDARLDELFGNVVEGIALMESETEEARAFLLEQERRVTPPKKVLEYLILVLSLTGETLSAQEITQRMIARGYEPRGQDPERYVRLLLRGHPQLFARQVDGRWSIASLESEGEENDAERNLQ